MSTSSIKAGEAFVEAYLEKSRLYRDMKSVSAEMSAWGKRITNVGAGVLGAGVAITAPLAAAVGIFTEVGGSMEDMSARTGISVGALSELGFAANQTGASMENVEVSVKKMQKTIAEASEGNKTAIETLNDLGVSMAELKGLTPDQQFARIAASIAKIPDPAKRTNAALSVFGKSGTQLLPMIQNFDQLAARARELGLILNDEDTAAADAFGDTLDELWAVGKKMAFTVGAALVPSLQGLATWLANSSAVAGNFINENRGLVTMAAALGVGLIGTGAGIMAFGVTLRTVAPLLTLTKMGISALVGMVGAIGPALAGGFALLISPLGLALAGVTALAVGFFTLTDTGKQSVASLGESFGVLLGDATTTFDGIKNAMQAGDFQLAAEILWAGLQVVWASGTATLGTIWADVIEVMSVAWNNAVAFVGGAWDALLLRIKQGQDLLAHAVSYISESLGISPAGSSVALAEDQKRENDAADAKRIQAEKDREKTLQDANLAAFAKNNAKRAALEENLANKRAELNRKVEESRVAVAAGATATPSANALPSVDTEAISKGTKVQGTFSASIASQITGADSTGKKLDEAKEIHKKQLTQMERVVRKLENSGKLVFTI